MSLNEIRKEQQHVLDVVGESLSHLKYETDPHEIASIANTISNYTRVVADRMHLLLKKEMSVSPDVREPANSRSCEVPYAPCQFPLH